jgi:drug/metabolite transporter (DMT)-like permease
MNEATPQRQLAGGVSGGAFLLGNVLCWSAVPVMLRYLTGSLDAWTANGIRYPLAAILYWPILIVAVFTGTLDRRTLRRCVIPSILAFGGQVLWALAPYYLPAGAIGFFIRFSLVFALVGAMTLFPDERKLLGLPAFYFGLLLSVVGFLALSLSKVQFDAEVTGTGIAVILFCGMLFGFYGVSVRYFLRGINPLIGFGIVSQFVSFGTLVAMFSIGNYGDLTHISQHDWLLLAGSSILGIALGHYFLYSAVTRLGAAVTSGAQTLAPFLTILLAAWFLGESMSSLEWCAGLTMVGGAALLLFAQNRLVVRRFDSA